MTQRSRGFCVTDFECQAEFWNEFKVKEKLVYFCLGLEIAPTTGKYHYQIYFYFENQRTLGSLIKKLKGRHVEIAKGSPEENRTYCMKEGNFIEEGKLPKQGERSDLGLILDSIKDENKSELAIATEQPDKWCQYGKRFEAYRMLLRGEKRKWETLVIINWGVSGTGKTRAAYEKYPNIVPVIMSGDTNCPFISGYAGEDEVLFDDFTPRMCNREYVLKLLDRYPMQANIKGGSVNWKPRVVVITTNENPTKWYEQDAAFIRRISEINFFQKVNDSEVLTGNTGTVSKLPCFAGDSGAFGEVSSACGAIKALSAS